MIAYEPPSATRILVSGHVARSGASKGRPRTPAAATPHPVLLLQRLAGNRAVAEWIGFANSDVGASATETMQRAPEPDPEVNGRYRDNEYPGVKLLKVGSACLYEVLNDGPYKGRKLLFSDGEWWLAEEIQRSAESLEGVIDLNDLDEYHVCGPRFDVSMVSAERKLVGRYAAGEKGIGVAYPTGPTVLLTSGLVTCVAWLLFNERGAYLTHIVVSDPAKVLPADIPGQVQGLYEAFVQNVGKGPATLIISVNQDCAGYPDRLETSWLRHLVPSGDVAVKFGRAPGLLEHKLAPSAGEPAQKLKIWHGSPVKLNYGP